MHLVLMIIIGMIVSSCTKPQDKNLKNTKIIMTPCFLHKNEAGSRFHGNRYIHMQ